MNKVISESVGGVRRVMGHALVKQSSSRSAWEVPRVSGGGGRGNHLGVSGLCEWRSWVVLGHIGINGSERDAASVPR